MMINDDEELEEWIDTAPLRPKKIGRVKIQIRPVRHLLFSSIPGEFLFEDEDDDNALFDTNRTI